MRADSNALKLYETVFSQKMVELKDIFDYHNAKTIDPEIIPNSISSITEEKINIWIKREEKTEPFCIKDLEFFIEGEKIRAGSEFTPHGIRDKIRTLQRKKSEWYGNKIVEDAKRKLEEETSEFNKLDSPDAKQIADLELTKSNHDWWRHTQEESFTAIDKKINDLNLLSEESLRENETKAVDEMLINIGSDKKYIYFQSEINQRRTNIKRLKNLLAFYKKWEERKERVLRYLEKG